MTQNISEITKEGIKYFKQGDYFKSVTEFNKVLQIENYNIMVRSNRSEAFLRLGYFSSALKDCDVILDKENDHGKALYRKARALENIESKEKIEEALTIFNRLLEKFKEDENILTEINRKIEICKSKFNNINGVFHLEDILNEEKSLFDSISKKDYVYNSHNKELRFMNYISKKLVLEYQNTKAGICWKATETIKEGELLIFEKPMIYLFEKEFEKFKYDLLRDVEISDDEDRNSYIYTILTNKINERLKLPEEKDELLNKLSLLYNGCNIALPKEERKIFFIDSSHELDEVTKKIISVNSVLSIRNSSAFKFKDLCYGLWFNFSFFNHSCIPNAFYYGIGPYIIVKAIKDIQINEEVYISYIEPNPYKERVQRLEKWNFKCSCQLCCVEDEIYLTPPYKKMTKKLEKLKQKLILNHISSYNQLKIFYNTRDTYEINKKLITGVEDILKIDIDTDTRFLNIMYIYLKNYGIVCSYSDMNEYKIKIFDKCCVLAKMISKREYHEILVSYLFSCKEILSDLKIEEINNEVNILNKILYEIST